MCLFDDRRNFFICVGMTIMVENRGIVVQKGLSEWWSEETEYVFQRIERWAAFVRGYNRLRSQRFFKSRSIFQEQQKLSWNLSFDKLNLDESSSSHFYNHKRSRRKLQPEKTRINCCGTFNYQSNSKLDSNCLETYRYDHSIYFKTIGDIRSDKKNVGAKNNEQDRVSISSEELVEWDVGSIADLIADKSICDEACNNYLNNPNIPDIVSKQKVNTVVQSSWPIVDLTKLDLNLTDTLHVLHSAHQDRKRN